MSTDPLVRELQRELLRYACQRQIFCPYSGQVLDVRRAVLVDGSDHSHAMMIMTAAIYDIVAGKLFEAEGRDNFDVLDGRILFGRKS